MVSTDQDEPQEYYVSGLGGVVVKRDLSTEVASLSRKDSPKSNRHPSFVVHQSVLFSMVKMLRW